MKLLEDMLPPIALEIQLFSSSSSCCSPGSGVHGHAVDGAQLTHEVRLPREHRVRGNYHAVAVLLHAVRGSIDVWSVDITGLD